MSQSELGQAVADANRAYDALKLCVDAVGARALVEDPANRELLEKFSRGADGRQAEPGWDLRIADLLVRQLDVYERAKTECIEIGESAKDGSIYAVAQRAAALGNRDAGACYVAMAWSMDRAHWHDAQFRDAYRMHAPAIIQAGIAAGDWRMVSLAQVAAGESPFIDMPPRPGEPENPFWQAPALKWLAGLERDPVRHLALVRLKQAGSVDASWRTRYQRLGDEIARSLSPGQVRAASDWANRTFQTAFKGRREINNDQTDPLTCQ